MVEKDVTLMFHYGHLSITKGSQSLVGLSIVAVIQNVEQHKIKITDTN